MSDEFISHTAPYERSFAICPNPYKTSLKDDVSRRFLRDVLWDPIPDCSRDPARRQIVETMGTFVVELRETRIIPGMSTLDDENAHRRDVLASREVSTAIGNPAPQDITQETSDYVILK